MDNTTTLVNRVVFLVCSLLLMVSVNAFGQDPEIEIPSDYSEMGKIRQILDANKTLKEELGMSDLNRITLQQMGNTNDALILQFSNDEPSLVKVRQIGNTNVLRLTQTGKNNASDISQRGVENQFTGYHSGEDIINKVIQKGYGNIIEQQLIGDHMDFQIKQDGNYNEVSQIYEDFPGPVGYKVIQKGDHMNIIIKQNQISTK